MKIQTTTAFRIAALTVAVTLAGSAMAEEQAVKGELTMEQRIARAKERRAAAERRLGGYIQAPATGLVVRVFNRQKIVSADEVRQSANGIIRVIGYGIEVVDGEPSDGRTAARIDLVEEADAPTLLIAPEDKWGKLNVSRLVSDKPSETTLRNRLTKELWRCYGMTLGAFNSGYSPCVMRTVFTLADLDGDPSLMPCPVVYDKIQGVCRRLNVDINRRVSYKKACQEGWAPPPTNDIQKAIWEQVKADKERGPTNPITIQPPGRVKSEE